MSFWMWNMWYTLHSEEVYRKNKMIHTGQCPIECKYVVNCFNQEVIWKNIKLLILGNVILHVMYAIDSSIQDAIWNSIELFYILEKKNLSNVRPLFKIWGDLLMCRGRFPLQLGVVLVIILSFLNSEFPSLWALLGYFLIKCVVFAL